jgi:carboxymethylenebutenolidase
MTTISGHLALPASGTGAGLLVLHAWWGLTDVVRETCDRLAREGYCAFAPDLFEGGRAGTVAEAEALLKRVDGQRAADIAARAIAVLHAQADPARPLGVIGFSYGAALALQLSNTHQALRAVVTFYGNGHDDFSTSQASYLAHYAASDPYEPAEAVAWQREQIDAAQRPLTVFHYPGTGHWFFERDRVDAFNAAAADLAWSRTLVHLGKMLAGPARA